MLWSSITRAQGGLVARRQLSALGCARSEIDAFLRAERLEHTSAQGVFRATGAPHTPGTPAWFAVLSSRSPLSFVSAAQWWEVPVEPDGLVHITRFDRRRLDWPAGVRVHRVLLDPSVVVEHLGMPVTSRVETLLDCLGFIRFAQAASLADRAVHQRWLTTRDIDQRLEEQPRRWGNKQLRSLLPHLGDGAAAESERRLHRILRASGIGGWVPNLSFVADGRRFEIDVAFPELRLAIEVDGRRYHSADDRFQADRTKQNVLIAAGWRVLRFTWADLVERPEYVRAQVCSVLAA